MPRDCLMTLPDFLIIGAMKCGTSTLQAQLSRQPGIFMSFPKEPNFFSDNDVFARGLDWYEQLFEGAEPGDLRGEASTHYTKLPTYPATLERLRPVLSAPKAIYLIRNPIKRLVSHYIHEWSMGVISDDLDTAIDHYPELIDYGRYAYQISPWVEAFGRKAVLVLTLEEMTYSPQKVLDRVSAFLGHEQPLVWQKEQAQVNVSAERFRRFPLHGLLVDNPIATTLRRALVPKALRNRIRQARQMTLRPTLSSERHRTLEKVFADDYAILSMIFPNTPGLEAAYPFQAK